MLSGISWTRKWVLENGLTISHTHYEIDGQRFGTLKIGPEKIIYGSSRAPETGS